jgi:hypothetical protein
MTILLSFTFFGFIQLDDLINYFISLMLITSILFSIFIVLDIMPDRISNCYFFIQVFHFTNKYPWYITLFWRLLVYLIDTGGCLAVLPVESVEVPLPLHLHFPHGHYFVPNSDGTDGYQWDVNKWANEVADENDPRLRRLTRMTRYYEERFMRNVAANAASNTNTYTDINIFMGSNTTTVINNNINTNINNNNG